MISNRFLSAYSRAACFSFCILVTLCTPQALSQSDSKTTLEQEKPTPTLIVPTPQSDSQDQSAGTLANAFAQINTLQDFRRAGLRASVIRQVQRIIPVVIIVDSAEDYLHAIEQWEGVARYPVLWDDGTQRSHEDIARFVRAFDPKKIYRISGASSRMWEGDRSAKESIFMSVLSDSIDQNAPDWETSLQSLADQGIVSPGLMLADVNDPAWPAALALSSARLQRVAFFTKPTEPMRLPMNSEQADHIERIAQHAAKRSGRTWDSIGDDIDMITLAANMGTMIKTGGGKRDRLSTTDRIGRTESNGNGTRWAWCGQIIGNESQATYLAMCSLFLEIDHAFIWDGYANKTPWSNYDGTAASQVLQDSSFQVELHDQPRYTLKDWRLRMVNPVGDADRSPGSASLFLMNSKGPDNVFQLPGSVDGQGKPGNLPMFDVPTALHIVHSFSLAKPMSRYTVGGRFLERGVYVYAGSVDEPYLHAFVPTPTIARRIVGSLAFATAVHYDNEKAWKITVIGDPLITIGSAGQRIDSEFNIQGAIELEARSKHYLKNSQFTDAIEDLFLMGKDEAIARLAEGLMKEQPEAITDKLATKSISALFRAGHHTALLRMYEHLGPGSQSDELNQDILWLSAEYLLARAKADHDLSSRLVPILRSNIRTSQSIEDAERLAMYLRDQLPEYAVGILEGLRPTLNENQQKRLDKAIKRVRQ